VIDWAGSGTEILLNPRLPAAEAAHVRTLIAAVPLSAHVWVTTSGSTGRLKPVALAKRAILASAAAVNAHLESDAHDVWLNVLPVFHVGGLGIPARAHLSGAAVVTLDAWDPTSFVAALTANRQPPTANGQRRTANGQRRTANGQRRTANGQRLAANGQRLTANATLTALVPTHVFDLVRAGLRAPATLRAVVVGGGALAPDLYRQGRALGWPLLPSYGATECASQIATASLASLASDASPDLRLLRHATARTAPDGRIEVRSDALFTGYATESGLDDPKRDGWWRTGDLGEVRGGSIVVHGRADDTVKVGGELVNLATLETTLADVLAAVAPGADAALFPAADDRLGTVVGVAMAAADAALAEQVRDSFNARVLPFERIRVVRVVRVIPRTALGKVARGELSRERR